jgi:Ca-activated chloride channel family protein
MTPIFLNQDILVLLFTIPGLAALLLWRRRVLRKRAQQLGDTAVVHAFLARTVSHRLRWRLSLWLGAYAALIIAAARPAWGINTEILEFQGVSVVVVLDVSNSMLAQDYAPNRLERARLAVQELFENLRGNEIGLVLFAGAAFVQFPLTTDVDSAQVFLNRVNPDLLTQQGTAVAAALRLGLSMFDDRRATARIMVLVTDGEDHEGDIDLVIQEAARRSVTIHTLGYGSSEGAPIPIVNDAGETIGYKVDGLGQIVQTRLNERLLRDISEGTNGLYQRADTSGSSLLELIRVIQQSKMTTIDSQMQSRLVERFGIFVLIALVLLTFEILTSENFGR